MVIKQYAKKRLINFTNETTPSAKLSATSNEIVEIITTKKNDKKCFLCLKVEANSLKLIILIIWVKEIMFIRDMANICGKTLSNERKKSAMYWGVMKTKK